MRIYAAFYNYQTVKHMVIFKDENEPAWAIEVPDAGSQEASVRIADALNAANKV